MHAEASEIIDAAARHEQEWKAYDYAECCPAIEEGVEEKGAQSGHAARYETRAASKGSARPRTWATRYLVYSVSNRAVLPGHRHQSSRLKCSVNTGCGTISIFGIVRWNSSSERGIR